MITTKIRIEEPRKMMLTLSITMSLGEWIDFKQQLDTSYPASKVGAAVNEAVRDMNNTFRGRYGEEMNVTGILED